MRELGNISRIYKMFQIVILKGIKQWAKVSTSVSLKAFREQLLVARKGTQIVFASMLTIVPTSAQKKLERTYN